jgi:hypothetical protein
MIYCHKPLISIALEEIPTWFAKSLCVGDFFEKKLGSAESELLSRELRRGALGTAKSKKLKVSCLESNGEVSYFYLTDGIFTYKMKILESKQNAFLMDFGTGGFERWITSRVID